MFAPCGFPECLPYRVERKPLLTLAGGSEGTRDEMRYYGLLSKSLMAKILSATAPLALIGRVRLVRWLGVGLNVSAVFPLGSRSIDDMCDYNFESFLRFFFLLPSCGKS